ncbi:polysaccharide pyruvyl transferase family protein [Flavobacterium restrictum]|uniref:Polysaccharide pyruvyl transferase family protein n=1 Tax=Flavobacterium restrictum TaxID=2594428 RepID=A0A553E562_9FLAO|nr:polysaccharide pyruvyl transferase family protein [Flavobacterium restrictum]TRX40115.1 polysaccharide pyruvyl transferase family protein [Flavobacterium restrictum]
MEIKKIYRKLVDNYEVFTRFQIWRFRNKYPVKYLNENYNTDTPTIHFLHRYITDNTGDLACGYYRYFLYKFENYRCIIHDINCVNFSLIKKNDSVIIGGGGLLNNLAEWNYNINKAVSISNKSVVWSAGFNSYSKKKIWNVVNVNDFKLFAVRDFNYKGYRCVPCATCFLPELDKKYPIIRRIGVVTHKDIPIHLPNEIHKLERISNSDSLDDMIEFIGNSEVVLTNSYHVAYWSALLQRKCILFETKSEKHKYHKYPPVFYSGVLEDDISRAHIYPNALEDCRTLTKEFVNEILVLISK